MDYLLSIKKTLKGLKAQLRWKLVEKSNLEEVRKKLLLANVFLFLILVELFHKAMYKYSLKPEK